MNDYQEYIVRKQQEYGSKFDASGLDQRFAEFSG